MAALMAMHIEKMLTHDNISISISFWGGENFAIEMFSSLLRMGLLDRVNGKYGNLALEVVNLYLKNHLVFSLNEEFSVL